MVTPWPGRVRDAKGKVGVVLEQEQGGDHQKARDGDRDSPDNERLLSRSARKLKKLGGRYLPASILDTCYPENKP
jgi:hypothetical protein